MVIRTPTAHPLSVSDKLHRRVLGHKHKRRLARQAEGDEA